jgi:hypothetical protein
MCSFSSPCSSIAGLLLLDWRFFIFVIASFFDCNPETHQIRDGLHEFGGFPGCFVWNEITIYRIVSACVDSYYSYLSFMDATRKPTKFVMALTNLVGFRVIYISCDNE